MLIRDMTDDDYFGHDAISQSRLKILGMEGGPARLMFGKDPESTAPQRFGRLIHRALLQPHLINDMYVLTDLPRAGTKAWEAEERAAMGREMIKRDAFNEAMEMARAVRGWSPDVAGALLAEDSEFEVAFFWEDPDTGLRCKGRADIANKRLGVIGDLKSTVDASYNAFRKDCRKYGYSLQADHYLDGWNRADAGWQAEHFIVIAIEKSEPYMAATYEFSPADLEDAREKRKELLALADQCHKAQAWPGYPTGIRTMKLTGDDKP